MPRPVASTAKPGAELGNAFRGHQPSSHLQERGWEPRQAGRRSTDPALPQRSPGQGWRPCWGTSPAVSPVLLWGWRLPERCRWFTFKGKAKAVRHGPGGHEPRWFLAFPGDRALPWGPEGPPAVRASVGILRGDGATEQEERPPGVYGVCNAQRWRTDLLLPRSEPVHPTCPK